jgi:hypothetical protein
MAGPPMIQSSGMNTSLPQFGPFWNTASSGKVAATDMDARMRRGNQRTGDADIFRIAQEMLGVIQAEREAEQRGDRRRA